MQSDPLLELVERKLSVEQYSDFVFAMQVVLHQSLGKPLDKAIEEANKSLHRSVTKAEYVGTSHWRQIGRVAQQFALLEMKAQVAGVMTQVISNWTQAVQKMLDIIFNGRLDRDRIEAFKALQSSWVDKLMQAADPEEETEQKAYLERIRQSPPRTIEIKPQTTGAMPSSSSQSASESSCSSSGEEDEP